MASRMSAKQTPATAEGSLAAPSKVSLKRDVLWTGLDVFINGGVTFLFRLVLARILAPSDFGMIAMALTTYTIVKVMTDFGLAAAVIQRPEEKFSVDVVNTAFSASVIVSVTLFLVNLLAVAPLAAWFYDSVTVGEVTAVIGVTLLFTPVASIGRAILFRQRRYRAATTARIISSAVSILAAIAYLLISTDVWVFVVQIVTAQLVLAIALYVSGDWKPRLNLDRGTFSEIFGFSGLVFLNDIMVSTAKNFDVFTLGRMLSQSQVGLYSLAFYLTDTVRMQLMTVLNRVMFTHYSSIQNDFDAIRENYVKTISWNTLAIFPLMISIILAGPGLLPFFLGDAWTDMGVPLQALALAVMAHAAGGTTSTLYKAIGRPGLDLTLFIITSVVLLLPMLIFGVLWAGVAGAAWAIALNKLFGTIIRQLVLDREIGSTLPLVAMSLAGSLLVQVAIVAVWILVMEFVPIDLVARAIAAIALGLVAYAGTLLLVRKFRSHAWPAFDTRTKQPTKGAL